MRADGSARRVLVVCNDADYFMRHRLAVVEHLVEHGADVTVVTGGTSIAPHDIDGWHYIHTPIERFSFAPFRDAGLWLRTLREVLRLEPVAVHLITLKPVVVGGLAAVAARLFCGRPFRILMTMPGMGRLMSDTGVRRGMGARLARALSETVVRHLSRRKGVCFSFETAHDRNAWLSRGLILESGSVVVEGAGVDPQTFFPAETARQSKPVRILFASRLLRSKGLDIFIETARRLVPRGDVEFLVAGVVTPGDPDAISPSVLTQEPAIRYLGEIDDMATLLRSCDMVCLPTRYGEGIPRVLLEAAATGLAAIASDLPGCCEAVLEGVTGRTVSHVSPQLAAAVEAAVVGYLDRPELIREHGDAAYRRFADGRFNQEAVALTFQQLLGV